MGMVIKDGSTGLTANVNAENKLETESVSIHEQKHVNEIHGDCYSLIFQNTPTGAGDVFGYMKNTSETKKMYITSIKAAAATDETIQIILNNTGTPGGTTAATTPANRNSSSGKTATGDFQQGNDITGLAGGYEIERILVDNATGSHKYTWDSEIIIDESKTISFQVVTGAILVNMTVSFYYH